MLICSPWGCHWRPGYWGDGTAAPIRIRTLLGLAPPLLVVLASAPLVGVTPPLAPLVTGLLLGRTRQRRDEMRAGLRQGEPARRESVPFQEKSSECEGIGKIGCR